jgi:hypothetical protein
MQTPAPGWEVYPLFQGTLTQEPGYSFQLRGVSRVHPCSNPCPSGSFAATPIAASTRHHSRTPPTGRHLPPAEIEACLDATTLFNPLILLGFRGVPSLPWSRSEACTTGSGVAQENVIGMALCSKACSMAHSVHVFSMACMSITVNATVSHRGVVS